MKVHYFRRKLSYLILIFLLGFVRIYVVAYSYIFRKKKEAHPTIRSIAAVWYWPQDFPAASYTRLGKWKEYFEKEGIVYTNFPIGTMEEFVSKYEKGTWTERYMFYVKTTIRRFKDFHHLRKYDVVWIDRWFLPYYPSKSAFWERSIARICQRLVMDSTDGSDYEGNPHLIRESFDVADRITVAFKGLYEFYQPIYGKKVTRVNYTVVEDKYKIRDNWDLNNTTTLGWMGNPYNFEYLKAIEGDLSKVAKRHPIKIIIISRLGEKLNVPEAEIEYHSFSENYEDLIQSFEIGLAPFLDNTFTITGKIGMKHQEFLLCQIPQVCSPNGISEHAIDGKNCLIAQNLSDWSEKINLLIENPDLRKKIAIAGRKMFLENYTFDGQWLLIRSALLNFNE